jgi:hypothetical protein
MSDEIKNQPAFPQHSWQRIDKVEVGECQPGMTMRDYFAASTLTGLLRNDFWNEHWLKESPTAISAIAEDCYKMADAMLTARNKG